MAHGPFALHRIRSTAAPLLLGVFLLAAQLAPVAHLATHRNDHTHGPELGHHDVDTRAGEHDGDHDSDHGHDHDDEYETAPVDAEDHDHDTPTQPMPSDHGRASIARFDAALLPGPPPPFLPPPSETLALPGDVVLRSHRAAPPRQPPARGAPRLF